MRKTTWLKAWERQVGFVRESVLAAIKAGDTAKAYMNACELGRLAGVRYVMLGKPGERI